MKLACLLLAGLAVLAPCATAEDSTVETMASTAKAFLASLDSEQLAKAKFDFAIDERENWHFIPKPRKGLPLREMTPTQHKLAHALLASGLSSRGYIKAVEIMSLDDILKQMEQGSGPQRDPEGYFFSVFGEPSTTGTWGFRIEGHHVSQNFTIAKGQVAGAPSFFGANPADVKQGPREGLRVLAHEEDYGRALIKSLTPEQLRAAIVADKAYPDILTMASRRAAIDGQPSGIELSKLDAPEKELLRVLLFEYANNCAPAIAVKRMEQIRRAGDRVFFAWSGGLEKGQGHYYRIQAADFLIEYDNTQNNANHIHSVWRDFNGDFGRDLLAEHYQSAAHAR